MNVVINASPLIFLAKIGRLYILNQLFNTVYIPKAVIDEISEGNLNLTDKNSFEVNFTIIQVKNLTAIMGLLGKLHLGEVEVMIGAIENNVTTVVLDDKYARNKAKQLGLKVTGTVGILLLAYNQGLIKDLRAEMESLQRAGAYISDEMLRLVLDGVK